MLVSFVTHNFLLPYSYAIVKVCWNHDPRKRTKFAVLAGQLSDLLEQEAGYLDLNHPLHWGTRRQSWTKAPMLQQCEDDKAAGKEDESVEWIHPK